MTFEKANGAAEIHRYIGQTIPITAVVANASLNFKWTPSGTLGSETDIVIPKPPWIHHSVYISDKEIIKSLIREFTLAQGLLLRP